jgi:glycosyltransferase involved in cell wall biosynthesis
MKLLFVLPEYGPHSGGGIATYYKDLLRICAERGHYVRVILGSPHTVGTARARLAGVEVEELDTRLFAKYLRGFQRCAIFPELQSHLAAGWAAWEQGSAGEAYDVVETTDWGLGFVPWCASNRSVAVQARLHGSIGQIDAHDPREGFELEAGIARLIERGALRHVDRVVTHARANQSFWRGLLGRSVDHEEPPFAVESPSSSDDSGSGSFALVVGRIQHWKGPTVLCEAAREMGKTAPNVLWAGRDMPYQRPSQSMSEWLRREYPDVWGRTITPIGAQSYDETQKLQRQAAFGVVPSLWDVYNFSCVEFMAVAKTVVCSTTAGASDLLTDGVNGFCFAGGDAHALAEKLMRCREDANALRHHGIRARATVERHLNPADIATQYLAAWQSLARREHRASTPDDWLRDFLTPGDRAPDIREVLDRLPFRQLAAYTFSRGLAKLLHRTRR